jgi:ABC-type Fe3+-hydroxamate transport system substrate-binding protein
MRVRDDKGQEHYLKAPPQRVALCTGEALLLWEKAGLFSMVQAACVGEGDNARFFYLPCEDSLLLLEVLYRLRPDWVWFSEKNLLTAQAFPAYVFAPKSTAEWLRNLRQLGALYDNPPLIRVADSLQALVTSLQKKLQEARRLRVAVIALGSPFQLVTTRHPLATLIQEAGGSVLYCDSLPPLDTLRANPPDVLLIPEGSTELLNDFLTHYPEGYTFPALQYKRLFSIERWMIERPFADAPTAFFSLVRILHPELTGSASEPPAEEIEKAAQEHAQ